MCVETLFAMELGQCGTQRALMDMKAIVAGNRTSVKQNLRRIKSLMAMKIYLGTKLCQCKTYGRLNGALISMKTFSGLKLSQCKTTKDGTDLSWS